uniref:Lipase domain-containing protein n=1 Tax=Timema bartmani TaxID=61472 RepID=A0A7R9EXG8_9NEOP|nr:unnamed protein product [Timema bartmani]
MINRHAESPSLYFMGVAFFSSRQLNHTSVQSVELCVRGMRSWHMCAGVRVQQGKRLNFTNKIPLKIGMKYLPEIFNPNYDTIFTVHSWVVGPVIMEDIIEGYIKTGKDYNLMAADWSPASGAGYIVSSLVAAEIGGKIAKFIDFLTTKGLSPSKISLIGYSLGCHVAGTAGFRVTSGRVGTVIALEPSGPVQNLFPPELRLTQDDADFVVVIHTNVGDLGYVGDLGHVDFYPNGGVYQPGCDQDSIERTVVLDVVHSSIDGCHEVTKFIRPVPHLPYNVTNPTHCYWGAGAYTSILSRRLSNIKGELLARYPCHKPPNIFWCHNPPLQWAFPDDSYLPPVWQLNKTRQEYITTLNDVAILPGNGFFPDDSYLLLVWRLDKTSRDRNRS